MREGQSYITSISIFKQESRDKIRAGSGFIHYKGWDSGIKKKKEGKAGFENPYCGPSAKAESKNENLSAEKMQILYLINTGSFQHHYNCGSTHPSMAASKENKLPPLFSGFKSQNFLHKPSSDGVSGTDNDEQSLKILSKWLSSLAARSVLLISKR